jgi:hypothetical protein
VGIPSRAGRSRRVRWWLRPNRCCGTRRRSRAQEVDERTLVNDEDPAFEIAARSLAERSAASGRVYAVVTLGVSERGRLLKVADAVEGVSAQAEGEGRLRRLVLTPENLVPMPRQRLPVDDLPEDD